jgi:hypothetical protein
MNNHQSITITYNINKLNYNKLMNMQIGGYNKPHDYYFLHSTNFANMIQILKSNKLYANMHIDERYRRFSGSEQSKYVFMNIVIDNYQPDNFGIGLIFSKDILNEYPIIFNQAWMADSNDKSIYINNVEEMNDAIIKLNMIDTINKSKMFVMSHEILFENEIDLKYLIGIHCPICDNKQKRIIRKLLRKNNKQYVKIYSGDKLPLVQSSLFTSTNLI